MSTLCRGLDTGALEGTPNDRSNTTLAKAAYRSFVAQKHATISAARASVVQVSGDCRANIRRKRKNSLPIAFSSNAHLSDVPVNVIELEKSHFAGTQPQPCEQQDDRVVAAADRSMPIDARQQLTDLVRSNRTRDRCHRPICDSGHCGSQVQSHSSAIARVTQEGTQGSGQ